MLVASEQIGLEGNAEKTKFMFTTRERNTGQYHNINVSNKSSERSEKFKKKMEGKEP